jgi:Collagen triple helix repeat (20 copies)
MSESTHEHVEAVIASKARRDWVNVLLIVVVVALLAWIAWDNQKSSTRADVATSNAQTLAEQIQQACLAGDVIVASKNVCTRADAVADQPNVPVQGAQGPAGDDGKNGRDGLPGLPGVNGPTGTTGPTGELGGNGQNGAAGPAGADGSAGANGVDGTPGPAGANGTDGRGITSIECVDSAATVPPTPVTSDWVITYTDGTTSTTPGPCRLTPVATP